MALFSLMGATALIGAGADIYFNVKNGN